MGQSAQAARAYRNKRRQSPQGTRLPDGKCRRLHAAPTARRPSCPPRSSTTSTAKAATPTRPMRVNNHAPAIPEEILPSLQHSPEHRQPKRKQDHPIVIQSPAGWPSCHRSKIARWNSHTTAAAASHKMKMPSPTRRDGARTLPLAAGRQRPGRLLGQDHLQRQGWQAPWPQPGRIRSRIFPPGQGLGQEVDSVHEQGHRGYWRSSASRSGGKSYGGDWPRSRMASGRFRQA